MLGLQHRRFLLKVGCFRGADRGFLLFKQRLVRIRFNFYKQVAFFHAHTVLDRQFDNLARDFRGNFHFGFGLYLTGRGDSL